MSVNVTLLFARNKKIGVIFYYCQDYPFLSNVVVIVNLVEHILRFKWNGMLSDVGINGMLAREPQDDNSLIF